MEERTRHQPIRKDPGALPVPPNMPDYEALRREFSWERARAELEGLPGGRGLNIAHEAVDRHAAGPLRERVALRWLGRRGERRELTFGELSRLSARFASALEGLGVARGETVFGLAGRIPELYVAALGTLKRGAVFCPLFSAFGPEPIRQRMQLGRGALLVTTEALYRTKVSGIRADLADLRHVVLVGQRAGGGGTLDWSALLERGSDHYRIPPTAPEDPALLHFTSGTTGRPKGALHVHEAVVAHHATGRLALDLHASDVFWCTADPGWVTGTSYGIVAPLACGVTSVVDEREFDAERWYSILEQEGVSVWYTAPTAVRMMMRLGPELPRRRRFPRLRFIASVGEPLHPEAVTFGIDAFGLPVHDNWWQTETGGIMIANYAAMDVRPGSMGRPLPGIEAAIVRRDAGGVTVIVDPEHQGELALRRGWPSMFRGYLGEPERTQRCFAGDWYLTGDLARRDAEGYFWFVGRSDDVIKSAGHLIGPFEVESALLAHPAVADAAVIGVPEPVSGELVKAFVVPKPGHEPSEALELELLAFARTRLGAAISPKTIAFASDVPRTRSGKILRRLLRARELGLPEGDTSTLEGSHP